VAVFPLNGKVPLTPRGCKDATADLERVAKWWQRWPEANVGVACGAPAGLFVVDLDGLVGAAAFVELQRRYGALPATLWARTGSGGWHAYFRHVAGLGNSAGKLAPHVDTRGDGGYVVAPPSRHPNGNRYRWHKPDTRPAELPGWLLRLLKPPEPRRVPWTPTPTDAGPYARAALDDECMAVATAAQGSRNHTLNRAAYALGTLVGARVLDEPTVATALADAARACGLPDHEAARTIRSGLDAGKANPRRIS
jgi:hypothetical protein